MYSLNQVNNLVSCGRDPARSLPFWRGFLLIPLILVWLCICAERTNDTRSGSVGGSLNTADGFHALFNVTGACKHGARLEFAPFRHHRQLQYWRWCWNAGSQQRRY